MLYSLAKVNPPFKLHLHFQLPILVTFSERGIDAACIFAFTKETVQPLWKGL